MTSSGNMPPVSSNRLRRKLALGDAKARGEARQVPHRVDRRLGYADFAIVEQHLPIGVKLPAAISSRISGIAMRAVVIAIVGRTSMPSVDCLGKHVADEMAPGVERDDFARIAPLRARRESGPPGRCR